MTFKTFDERRKEIEAQISKAKGDLATLEVERAAAMAPFYELAKLMHESFCRWNHTDGCSFHYETKNGTDVWESSEHQRWLEKAAKLHDMHPDFTIEHWREMFNILCRIF